MTDQTDLTGRRGFLKLAAGAPVAAAATVAGAEAAQAAPAAGPQAGLADTEQTRAYYASARF